ncbi:type II secretion system protein GspJ [Antarctobacter heliothermus]|uniref:Type II secretion system protein J n=1 Tax=Antarctobacter heliothermus TaxID=74033 RepID=A0A239HDF8_9RHOB|nr:type II secretion system protein GspJ [Antarctobacter heliothermus]SNS79439.1 general secretion pathway protein J [Antarctobacter heliothermus]
MTRGDRGLSLLELVVAMALFALVAVMGIQTLGGTIRSRDVLTARDDRDQSLGVTLALLRSDLDHVAPLLFFPPDSPPQSALYQVASEGRIGLTIAAPTGAKAPFQRAEWRLDREAGVLSRRFWPVTTPARADQRSPERAVMPGVSAMRLRSFWTGYGWIEGTGADLFANAPPPSAADGDAAFALVANTYSDTLPAAIEITLVLDGLGDIRLIEVLQ